MQWEGAREGRGWGWGLWRESTAPLKRGLRLRRRADAEMRQANASTTRLLGRQSRDAADVGESRGVQKLRERCAVSYREMSELRRSVELTSCAATEHLASCAAFEWSFARCVALLAKLL